MSGHVTRKQVPQYCRHYPVSCVGSAASVIVIGREETAAHGDLENVPEVAQGAEENIST